MIGIAGIRTLPKALSPPELPHEVHGPEQTTSVTAFLQSELGKAKKRLDEAEASHNKKEIKEATAAYVALYRKLESARTSASLEEGHPTPPDEVPKKAVLPPPAPPGNKTVQNAILLVGIMAVDLLVLWVLNKIKPDQSKTAEATSFKGNFSSKFKGMAGTITVAAAGSLGSFLTVLAVTIAAILVLDKFG